MFLQLVESASNAIPLDFCGSCGFILFWIVLGFCSSMLGFRRGVLLLVYNYQQAYIGNYGLESGGYAAGILSLFGLNPGGVVVANEPGWTTFLSALPVGFFWCIGSFLSEVFRFRTATMLIGPHTYQPDSEGMRLIGLGCACESDTEKWARALPDIVSRRKFTFPLMLSMVPNPMMGMITVVAACMRVPSRVYFTAVFLGRVLVHNILVNLILLFLTFEQTIQQRYKFLDTHVQEYWMGMEAKVNSYGIPLNVMSGISPYTVVFILLAFDVMSHGIWAVLITLFSRSERSMFARQRRNALRPRVVVPPNPPPRRRPREENEYEYSLVEERSRPRTPKRRARTPVVVPLQSGNPAAASHDGLELLQTPIVNPETTFPEGRIVRRSARLRSLRSDRVRTP